MSEAILQSSFYVSNTDLTYLTYALFPNTDLTYLTYTPFSYILYPLLTYWPTFH